MTDIDYSKYSYEDLVDILSRIQKDKYPEKVDAIKQQIELKKNEYEPPKYFSLFGQSRVLYKSKLFILSFVVFVSILTLINLSNILIEQKIISIIIFPILFGTLVLILASHPKVLIAIQVVSVIFIVLGGFSLLAVIFEFLQYLLKTSEEYSFGLSVNIFTGLIIFFVGVFYFTKSDEYIITNKVNTVVA